MSSIGKNIRKIRTIKGLSQSDFANLFDLTRASISAYEENRAEPKMDVAIKIAKYFNIPLEKLITMELTVNEYAKFNLQNFIVNNSALETVSIPIVSARNWDSFLKKESMSNFPTFKFPKHFVQGELAIEVNENINTNLHSGTILLCTEQNIISENGVYLSIDKKITTIENGNQITKSKTKRLFRVFQKIEEMNAISTFSIEERLNKLEIAMEGLLGK
ncbi:helix-turn-helix transcriptional regulator [Cryomorpha ignava]|uniref:Helix-turn-helix transcriptional regulator n=1 Tax=Cryomorpha ignava TaxID=101383 RepID=A0A7K3WPV0_9FLAO|nr:helix-turn-helix transcriptional regulator [Cryomorpha ignava]NEN23677.1 helix-turn-helix transcriptional regulator [Cryomorpha ignava]